MKLSEAASTVNPAYLPTQELWLALQPLLPAEKPKDRGGRTRVDDYKLFQAMFYVLRTGIQWKALPRELAASSTTHDRYQEWVKAGVFAELWRLGLMQNQVEGNLDWQWQCIDSASSKAPLGGQAVGANPTDRGKGGSKRHILTEAHGLPVALTVTGANVHDKKQVEPLLESMPLLPPLPDEENPQHFCADKGYDYSDIRSIIVLFLYQDQIKARGEEKKELKTPGYRARRWVCERTHSWMNRFRRILIRWEKKVNNYLAFLHLACAHIVWKNCTLADPFQVFG
jgi:putative transposase